MSLTRTIESRPLDHVYDSTFHSSAMRGARPDPKVSTARAITGTQRYKYHRRPVVPRLEAVAPQILLAPTVSEDPNAPVVEAPMEATREVEVQTMYRESEAQTNPYTPEFVQPQDGSGDEVAMLAGLSFGDGLPVGQREIQMIENARHKRALEAALPPTTDQFSVALRIKLMEQQEMREFNLRTKELDAKQAERIRKLQQALEERDQGNEFLQEQRVEALRQKRVEERDKALVAIQNKRIKVLRKLAKKRAQAPGLKEQTRGRDIIRDYAEHSSAVYAPLLRNGHGARRGGSANQDVSKQTDHLSGLENLSRLEQGLPLRFSRTTGHKPDSDLGGQAKVGVKTLKERQAMELSANVQKMHTIFSAGHGQHSQALAADMQAPAAELPAWRTRVSKVERPPTPDVMADAQEAATRNQEPVEAALVLLQRLIRGRAVQNTMYEGRDRRMDLIRELKAEDVIGDTNTSIEATIEAKRTGVREAAVDTIAGVPTSSMLDFLAKEKIRKDNLERVANLAQTAEEDRRRREVEESGRRQAEDKLRTREDEVYRQVVRTHYSSANSFVDSIMENSVDRVSSGSALDELRENPELARALLEAAAATPRTTQSLTRDLVASFLNPSIERMQEKQASEQEDLRYVDAAHKVVGDVMNEVVTRKD